MTSGEFSYDELQVLDTDIYLAMGYKGQTPDPYILEVIDEVKREAAPLCHVQYMYQIVESRPQAGHTLCVQDQVFSLGKIISAYLTDTTHICLFVATAGVEFDNYLKRIKEGNDTVKEYVADSLGSVLAEACVNKVGTRIGQSGSLRQTLPYSPGYCGWNINEQSKFFRLFPDKPCGITLNQSNLMLPVKSISGIIGLGENLIPQPYRCEICTNKNCYKRKI